LRVEVVAKAIEEEQEALVGFAVKHNGAGEHALAQAALRGFLQAFGAGGSG